jgi:hypothetical protein
MPQPQRNVWILKIATMKTPSRDLLVLLKNEFASEQAIEQEVRSINHILIRAESPELFCIAHELVTRRSITSSSKKILLAIRFGELKPFYFLINKN